MSLEVHARYGNVSGLRDMTLNISDFMNETNLPETGRCGWRLEARVETPLKYLDWATYPILLSLASFGNFFNLLILCNEHPQTSKNVYLISLACTDFIYMWSGFFPYIAELLQSPSEYFDIFYKGVSGLCFFVGEAACLASDWTIVAFTVDRFLAIKSPLVHMSLSTMGRSSMVVILVNFLAGLTSINRLVDYYWFYVNDPGYGPMTMRPAPLERWRTFYGYTVAIVPLITFLTILTLNGVLITVVLRRRHQRPLELQASSDVSSPSKSNKSAYKMLASCVMLYLVTQLPSFVVNIFELMDLICVRQMSKFTKAHVDPIKNMLLYINYSSNFLLYCAVSSTFRSHVKRCSTKKRDSSSSSVYRMSSVTGSVKSEGHRESNLRRRDGENVNGTNFANQFDCSAV